MPQVHVLRAGHESAVSLLELQTGRLQRCPVSRVRGAFPITDLSTVPTGEARGLGEVGGCCSCEAWEDEAPELRRAARKPRSGARTPILPMPMLSRGDARADVGAC
jgi:hypothetical protein